MIFPEKKDSKKKSRPKGHMYCTFFWPDRKNLWFSSGGSHWWFHPHLMERLVGRKNQESQPGFLGKLVDMKLGSRWLPLVGRWWLAWRFRGAVSWRLLSLNFRVGGFPWNDGKSSHLPRGAKIRICHLKQLYKKSFHRCTLVGKGSFWRFCLYTYPLVN